MRLVAIEVCFQNFHFHQKKKTKAYKLFKSLKHSKRATQIKLIANFDISLNLFSLLHSSSRQ